MAEDFSLTLYHRSQQPGLTFVLYAVVPVSTGQKRSHRAPPAGTVREKRDAFALAWFAQPVDPGQQVTFEWTPDFSLVYAAQGCRAGSPWSANATVHVNCDDTDQNCVVLDRPDGAYSFAPAKGAHGVKPPEVYVDATGAVPGWTPTDGPSVGLAVTAGKPGKPVPVVVTDSGPNLTTVFHLVPEYHIWAGQQDAGTMNDFGTVLGHQRVTYAEGVRTAAWTLDAANLWVRGAPPADTRLP